MNIRDEPPTHLHEKDAAGGRLGGVGGRRWFSGASSPPEWELNGGCGRKKREGTGGARLRCLIAANFGEGG